MDSEPAIMQREQERRRLTVAGGAAAKVAGALQGDQPDSSGVVS